MNNLNNRLQDAIQVFWNTRQSQSSSGISDDQGSRSAVTGGKQMDGIENLIKSLLVEAGVPEEAIFCQKKLELPGFFRPEKRWDLLVILDQQLIVSIELKSQVGPSFGNNFNNRIEEALGSANDLWTAYREGAFKLSQRPWLGYFFLLEESPKSTSSVKIRETHFPVLDDFRDSSYAKRYELFCTKIVRERLYDTSCLILSDRIKGLKGNYREPVTELGFKNFSTALLRHVKPYLK